MTILAAGWIRRIAWQSVKLASVLPVDWGIGISQQGPSSRSPAIPGAAASMASSVGILRS